MNASERRMKLARIEAFLDEFLDREKLLLSLEDGTTCSILAVTEGGEAFIEQGEDTIDSLTRPLNDQQIDALYEHVMARKRGLK